MDETSPFDPPDAESAPPSKRPLQGLANVLVVLLFITTAVFALSILGEVVVLLTMPDAFVDPESLTAPRFAVAAGVYFVILASRALFLLTAITWCIWQSRGTASLQDLGLYLHLASPRAWVWWFVPLAQLGMPYMVHAELWKASGGDPDRNPLGRWWASWLVWQLGTPLADVIAPNSPVAAALIHLVALVAFVVSGFDATRVVTGLSRLVDTATPAET